MEHGELGDEKKRKVERLSTGKRREENERGKRRGERSGG